MIYKNKAHLYFILEDNIYDNNNNIILKFKRHFLKCLLGIFMLLRTKLHFCYDLYINNNLILCKVKYLQYKYLFLVNLKRNFSFKYLDNFLNLYNIIMKKCLAAGWLNNLFSNLVNYYKFV